MLYNLGKIAKAQDALLHELIEIKEVLKCSCQ
jgi:hypothetical protein